MEYSKGGLLNVAEGLNYCNNVGENGEGKNREGEGNPKTYKAASWKVIITIIIIYTYICYIFVKSNPAMLNTFNSILNENM